MKSKSLILFLAALLFLTACSTKGLQRATERGAVQLKASEIRDSLSGRKTYMIGYDDEAEVIFHGDGRLSAKNTENLRNDGIWKINKDERLCLRFKRWGNGEQICYAVLRLDGKFLLFERESKRYEITITGTTGEAAISPSAVQDTPPQGQTLSAAPPSVTPQNAPPPLTVTPQDREDIGVTIRELARDCQGCNLRGADLNGADLRDARLEGANLTEADLKGANLRRANLQGANLYKADLSGADLNGANLTGANLQGAVGLDR